MSKYLYKGDVMNSVPNESILVNYDNTDSSLSATTVQGAIDELASNPSTPSNVALIAEQTTPTTTTPRDADTLGGHSASYFASASELEYVDEKVDSMNEVTSGSATATSGGTCAWYKCGKIVTLNLGGTITASANATIYTGVPKPITNLNFIVANSSTSMTFNRYTLTTDGNVVSVQATSSYAQRCSFSYITTD